MFKEFKEFAIKGNVVDMAVGIIIGTAFGKIVSSFVTDIIMPPIGLLIGGIDFSSFAFTLQKATDTKAAITINYGVFLNVLLNFLIVSFVIFLFIKQLNRLKKKDQSKPAQPVQPTEEILLLRDIRDSLQR